MFPCIFFPLDLSILFLSLQRCFVYFCLTQYYLIMLFAECMERKFIDFLYGASVACCLLDHLTLTLSGPLSTFSPMNTFNQ